MEDGSAGEPSVAEAAPTLNCALSLFRMVPVAEPLVPEIVTLRPPLTNPPNAAVNISSASTVLSAAVVTLTVCVVAPAAKVTV